MKRLLPLLIGLALFGVVLFKVPLGQTWEILRQAHWGWILLSFALILIMVWLKGLRWSFLLRMQGVRYSVWDSTLVYLSSLLLGTVTPGRMGDFVKIIYLKRDRDMSYGLGMSSVLVDRVFDLYILLILGCLGLLFHPVPDNPDLVRGVWVFFGILVAASFLAFHRKTGQWMLKAIFQRAMGEKLQGRADKAFEDFHKGMTAYYRPAILWPTILTVLSYVCFFVSCWMMARALEIQIGVLYLTFCMSVVNIVSLLTFAGMGTREGAVILLFGLEHISRSQSLAYSLVLLFVGTVLISAAGFWAYLARPVKFDASGTLPPMDDDVSSKNPREPSSRSNSPQDP